MKTVASMLVAVALLIAAGSARAQTTLYVGDTKDYAIAFKSEEARLYVLELAGTTNCYYSEPHEDIGPGGFSAFAAPTLMRSDSEGLHAYDSGRGTTRVRAELDGGAVRGDFAFSESELSYHCDTGFEPTPFQASRYEPVGSGAAPVSGERPVYYGSEASTEVFLRVINGRAGGIRGTFVPRAESAGRRRSWTGTRFSTLPPPSPSWAKTAASNRKPLKKGGRAPELITRKRSRSPAALRRMQSPVPTFASAGRSPGGSRFAGA
jgi:hypothetical protein